MSASHADLPGLEKSTGEWRLLSEINLPRQPSADKLAVELVAHIIEDLHLPTGRLEQLKLAVAAATINAFTQRKLANVELPVSIRVLVASQIIERLQGDHPSIGPDATGTNHANQTADAGILRGWGFFVIDRALDEPSINQQNTRQRIEIYIYLDGGRNASRNH